MQATTQSSDGSVGEKSGENDVPMKVKILEATPAPERLACAAARGDYFDGYVGDEKFADLMSSVDGDTLEEKKRTLIKHLFRSGHFGPFEHPNVTIAVRGISRSCMAQLTRHRHASFDVQSMRYVDFSSDDPETEAVLPPSLRDAHHVSRETGLVELEGDRDEMREDYWEHVMDAFDLYNEMVDNGVPKEDARMVLPIGTRVNLTFTMNARAIMHLLDMRLPADAQHEIRELSNLVLEECKEWMPITFELYEEKSPNKLAP